MKKENKQKFYANYENDIKLKKPLVPIIYKRWEYKYYKNANFALSWELDELLKELEKIKDFDSYFENEKLEFQDVLVAMIIGTVGSLISTNDDLQEFLRLFHDRPEPGNSESSIQKKIRKRLSHPLQEMDQHERQYLKRSGEDGVPFGFHRLFRGHDILSWQGDNPFQLLIGQFGFAEGIKKAILHLLADTCSTQGLPVPLHSIFDVQNGNELDNMLHKWSLAISKETKQKAVSVFNNMFTIHASDMLGGGTTIALQNAYLSICNFETKKAKDIFKIIVQVCNFIITGIIGFIQTHVPKINHIALYNLVLPTASLIGISIKNGKIKRIEKKYNLKRDMISDNRKQIYRIYRINYLIYSIIFIFGFSCYILVNVLSHKILPRESSNIITSEITSVKRKFYDENSVIPNEDGMYFETVLQKKGFAFLPEQKDFSYFVVRVPDSKNALEELRYKTSFFMAEYAFLLVQAMLKGEVKYQLDVDNTGYRKTYFDKTDLSNFYTKLNDLISTTNLKFDNTYPARYSFFKEYELDKNENVVRSKENPFDENNQIKKSYNTYKSLCKLIENRWFSTEIIRHIESKPRPNFVKPIEEYSIFYEDVINTYSDGKKQTDKYVFGLYKLNTDSFINLYLDFAISLTETDYMTKYNQKVKEFLDSQQ